MKQYLSKKEKDHVVAVATLAQYVADIMPEWQDNLTGNERKFLKMAASFTSKALKNIIFRLDCSQRELLERQIAKTKCVCLPRESADFHVKRVLEESTHEQVPVESAYFQDILYQCLLSCAPCHWQTQAEKANCKVRYALLAMDIDVYDSQATGCPYEITK